MSGTDHQETKTTAYERRARLAAPLFLPALDYLYYFADSGFRTMGQVCFPGGGVP